VKVLSADNTTVLSESAYFSVAAVEVVPRPFIYAERAPSPTDPAVDYILGGQYFNKGDQEKAGIFLERAYRKSPQTLQYAEGLSRFYFRQGKYEDVQKILRPFSESPQKNNQFLRLLGQASQKLKQFDEAITHYKQYLSHFGTNLDVLNAIGSCYYSLGNQTEALRAWERSLEINPNQEQIKKIVASIKGEK
jgi:tetratricopeptide (TPR) repeat protein